MLEWVLYIIIMGIAAAVFGVGYVLCYMICFMVIHRWLRKKGWL